MSWKATSRCHGNALPADESDVEARRTHLPHHRWHRRVWCVADRAGADGVGIMTRQKQQVVAESPNLDALASTIKRAHAESQQAAGHALEHAIAAGHGLNQAKRLLKLNRHGRWLPWLREHVGIPERTAQLYMKLATHAAEVLPKSATVADFGVRQAAKMLVSTSGRVNSRTHTFEDWFTPQSILDLVTEVMGGIDCDPCYHPKCLVRAKTTFTKQDDGLAQQWLGRAYVNPPFGSLAQWIAKFQAEVAAGHVTEAIVMGTSSTDAAWWHALRDYPRCFLRGRPRFANAENETPSPIAMFYFGRNADRFARVFESIGGVYVRYRPQPVRHTARMPSAVVAVARKTKPAPGGANRRRANEKRVGVKDDHTSRRSPRLQDRRT
jgi:DNA N-6-adenine-methyltransferase (Dam)/Protein of unknown function (DUF3102)